jgi:hypothetical protein
LVTSTGILPVNRSPHAPVFAGYREETMNSQWNSLITIIVPSP